jgi:3'-5' exonuclease
MFQQLKLDHLLVFDIETVPVVPELESLSEEMQKAWESKVGKNRPEDVTPQDYFFNRAGIYAEFGKVICISAGIFTENKENGILEFRIKSFYDKNEKKVLQKFIEMLNLHYNRPEIHALGGHNVKEFDIPYLCRRILVNGLILPKILDIAGKKPWEVNFVDTLTLWKFGDYKNYTSLALLAALFDIDTPKDDIDGSEVGGVYWNNDDLERIVTYCQKDVLTVSQLLLRFKGMPALTDTQIIYVD